jgi:hypothetical protein
MALTLNTYPNRIDSSGTFNVTTDKAEDSTHVNLRIRADIYHEGIIKAIVEKPKGIPDFDFSDILKSLTPGLLFARDSGDIVKTGSIGSNLITSWGAYIGTCDILTTTGSLITRAEKTGTDATFIKTNDIAVLPGELYLVYCTGFVSSGSNSPYMIHEATVCSHAYQYTFENNKGYLIMPTAAGMLTVGLGHYSGAFDFTGQFYCYKITTNRLTTGNSLAPYFVLFTEVYENSSGVTTTDATAKTTVLRYVPARGDGTAFTEFVMHDNACLFANRTLKNNTVKFFTVVPNEYWLSFFTEFVELELFYSKDGGAYDHATHPVCYEGWGAVILNIGELLASVTTSLAIYFKNITGTVISSTIIIYPDTSQIDERVVLEFDGLVGGKEYLAFEGIKDLEFTTIRNYYSGNKKNKKVLSLNGICTQKIETRFKDIANAEYLKSLLIAEDVKKLEASYATPTSVTITTDNVVINKGIELFTNQLTMEYEY